MLEIRGIAPIEFVPGFGVSDFVRSKGLGWRRLMH